MKIRGSPAKVVGEGLNNFGFFGKIGADLGDQFIGKFSAGVSWRFGFFGKIDQAGGV